MIAGAHADARVEQAARWRADLILVLARTIAALITVPAIALLAARLQAGRFADAAVGIAVYGLLVLAALHRRLSAGWRVAAVLGVLSALTLNTVFNRGLALNVGVLGGTSALLALLAWGRAAATASVAAWVLVFAAAASGTLSGAIVPIAEQGPRSVLSAISLWLALTIAGVVALSAVIARLESGVRSADEFERRLRSEARDRLALAHRVLSEEEVLRGDLARELHDDIGQRLTAIKIALETAALRRQDMLGSARHETVRLLRDLARDTSQSANLGASPIERGTFGEAVEALVRREAARAGMIAVVDIDARLKVAGDARRQCYRIVQEALTNAIRHSCARRIIVRTAPLDGRVELVVQDNGVGFDVDAARRLGAAGARLGLVGMRERAGAIGAHLEIQSSPGCGTEIRIRLPNGGAA